MRGLETSGGARVRSFAVGEKKRGGPPRVRERRSSTLPVRVRSDAGVGVGVGSASSAPSTVGSSSGATEAASVIAATTSAFIAGVAPSATRSSFSAAASASRAAELPSLDATRVRRDDDTRRLFVVPKDAAASTTTRVAGRAALRPVPTRVLATTAVARAGHAIAALVIVFVFPQPPRCAQGSADASISDSRATCRSQPRVWTVDFRPQAVLRKSWRGGVCGATCATRLARRPLVRRVSRSRRRAMGITRRREPANPPRDAGRRLAPRNSMSNPSVPGLLSFFFLFLAFLSSPAVAHPNFPGGCSALDGHGLGDYQW